MASLPYLALVQRFNWSIVGTTTAPEWRLIAFLCASRVVVVLARTIPMLSVAAAFLVNRLMALLLTGERRFVAY
jgi:hypothetical protein